MSEGKTTTDKSKKRTSRTSSGTVHNEEVPNPDKRYTRSTEEKNSIKEEQKINSAQGEISEEDDDVTDENTNETYYKVNDNHSTAREAKPSQSKVPIKPQKQSEGSPAPKNSLTIPTCYIIGFVVLALSLFYMFSNGSSDPSSGDEDWRSQIDPNGHLPTNERIMVFASLKPILDKCSTDQDEGVSTLLILSSDEEIAAKLARCLLQKVNKRANKDQISTEIDLGSHRGGKLTLDSKLRTLLNTTDTIRAVLLRRIGDIPSDDVLDQLRLLFAYCDGENPVIPHRLIIMTATSNTKTEKELRENFKARLPNEHDFVEALMSRISGHTLYVEKDQKSIC